MKVAASPRSRAQVATVLAFVISHTTFLAAQDDETGRCPKVVFKSLATNPWLLIPAFKLSGGIPFPYRHPERSRGIFLGKH